MSLENLSVTDQKELTKFIDEGVAILQRIDDERTALKDLAKTLAEKWEVKPSVLTKAVSTSWKQSLEAKKDEVSQVETILQYCNRA